MNHDAIQEMFESLGTVRIRRLFGGKGIYFDGVIIAIEMGDEILLKADSETAPLFEEAGSSQWQYSGKNKPVQMPYWSIPEEALDDPDELARWVRLAYEAGRRAG